MATTGPLDDDGGGGLGAPRGGLAVGTVALLADLPRVRVLAQSLAAAGAGGRLTVLLVDGDQGGDGAGLPGCAVLGPADVGVDPGLVGRMAVAAGTRTVVGALRPWLLQALLAGGSPAALFLHPAMALYGPLDGLEELVRRHGIVVVPQVIRPVPLDGRTPTGEDVLAAGVIHPGFLAVSAPSAHLLELEQDRLRVEAGDGRGPGGWAVGGWAPGAGERWLDLLAGTSGARVLADAGYCLSARNLHERTLTWSGGSWSVDGAPLRCVDFSGYDPDAPWRLGPAAGARPRVSLPDDPALARLHGDYGHELLDAGGGGAGLPDRFGTTAGGITVDPAFRYLYREWLEAAARGERPLPPDPSDPAATDTLLEELNQPAAPAPLARGRLTRYQERLYLARPDLHPIYPEPTGKDYPGFLSWARADIGRGAYDPRLMGAWQAGSGEPPGGGWAPPGRLRPGITVAGYLRAEQGMGELARLTARTVATAGIELATVESLASPARLGQPAPEGGDHGWDLDTNVICVDGTLLDGFRTEVGSDFFEGRTTIWLWAWELEEAPPGCRAWTDLVDEVWAVSEFMHRAIAPVSTKPVHTFSLPIVAPPVAEQLDRAALGLGEGPYFLFSFDLLSVMERKNPVGLIEAFSRAFPPGQGPTLVVKAINGSSGADDLARLRWAAAARPDVVIVDRVLDAADNGALMAAADCFVSLHRSEGFGLSLGEAMALGKPVIATGYGGNLDFMTEENSFLVPFRPGTVPAGCPPYPEGFAWAEPDLDAAVELLRQVAGDPRKASAVGAVARADVEARHSVTARARFVADRFGAIQGRATAEDEAGAEMGRPARRWRR